MKAWSSDHRGAVKPLRFKKGVAEGMARDIMKARRQILRRADPMETWVLMRLADDIKSLGEIEHLESLATKFEEGDHYLARNLDNDPHEAQEVANEMAADLRVLKGHAAELVGEPVTVERLRQAEELLCRYGVELDLVDRAKLPKDVHLN